MEKKSEFKRLTLELLKRTHILEEKFGNVKKSAVKGDFFEEVKPFANKTKEMNDEWRKMALSWVEEERPKNIHHQQIESTSEQIEIISVQAFFPETSLTRFKNMVASIKYILNNILSQINGQ